ncbi:MAG: hypothetical protein E7Z76_05235 [Methanobrevibacter sp.]|nr:hypothetical protein [Methanobrevibacter sp.]
MRKIFVVLIALIAICITVSAASAADWSFNFGTDSNTNGGSVNINNNELKIQDEKFTIPDGYKENESARDLAADAKGKFEGAKVTICELNKENETVLIKVFFSDGGISDITGLEGSENKTIGGHQGFLTIKEDEVIFDYGVNNKAVEIIAPNEADIEAVLK